MYSFDEKGNVLIDTSQSQLITEATRNRTISPRAIALSQNQFVPFNPITHATWHSFAIRLHTMFSELFQGLKVPLRAPVAPPRGANDFRSLYFRMLGDWASTDLQGFRGPIPAAELNGMQDIVFFLPADGAVIRYLGRLIRKYPDFFQIHLGLGNAFTRRITTVDNSAATLGDAHHCMSLRVKEGLAPTPLGRIDNNVATLRAIKRTMELKEIIPGLNKILTTLSRKIRSVDGSWGEDPKFPIVNFHRKVPISSWVSIEDYDRNFHGNNKDLYADRAVYSVIDNADKIPFIQTEGSSGEHKWTHPRP